MEDNKKPWLSKTVWLGILGALAPLAPGVDAWIKGNELVYAQVLSLLFLGLRFVTKGKISIE